MAKNIDFMGATFPDVPSIRLPQHEGGLVSFTDVTDTTAIASDVASGKYFYTADGEKTVGTASGGITPSGTYSITSNGIYDIVSFASVDVNVSGGGGGSDGLIDDSVTSYYNDNISSVRQYAFYGMKTIESVELPNVSSVGSQAFRGMVGVGGVHVVKIGANVSKIRIGASAFADNYELIEVEIPHLDEVTSGAFSNCSSLPSVTFPIAMAVSANAFSGCTALSYARFDAGANIRSSAFANCKSLMTFINLGSFSTPRALANVNAFANTPMSNSTYTGSFGSIYVPASLVDSYKSATNWSRYADRITSYVE